MIIASLTCCGFLLLQPITGNAQSEDSQWDREMLRAKVRSVSLRATSISDAWKKLSTLYLLRTVLVLSGEPEDTHGCHIEQGTSTGLGVINKLMETYSNYTFEADQKYGVVWIFPNSIIYRSVLTQRLSVVHFALSAPLLSSVLYPMANPLNNEVRTRGMNEIFHNTFDYATDLPAGNWSVRDVINMACVQNPSQTFLIARNRDGSFQITPVNLADDDPQKTPSEGSLLLWNLEIGSATLPPTLEQISTALSARTYRKRWAARSYLSANIWQIPTDELVSIAKPGTEAIWSSVGVLSVLARSSNATHSVSIGRLKRELNEIFQLSGDSKAALVGSAELACHGEGTTGLELAMQRKMSASDILDVSHDLARICRRSAAVRQSILKGRPAWLDADQALLSAITGRGVFEE